MFFQVKLTSLIGEACVVDVPEEVKFRRSNYALTVSDVKDWERKNGPFSPDCIVIIRSGQGIYWGDHVLSANNYLGSDTPDVKDPETGFPNTLNWPGVFYII